MVGAHFGAPGSEYYDEDRPRYHVQPPCGWINDPNAPVFYKGRYHMFYQHLPQACEWDFGIVWGHAVSSDLVRWEHLPPALVPTPGWADADGCFSGCCVVEPSGRPVILYTGVRLRSNAEAGPLPPDEHDLGMVWIESQCAAVPEDPEDDLLVRWRKQAAPFLPLPPAHMGLTGWRDPFVFEVGAEAGGGGGGGGGGARSAFAQAREWRMLIGSGLKGQGGAALVYRSSELTAGWELEGTLCEGSSVDTGVVWECPLLVPLAPVPLHLRAATPRAPPRWLTERAAAAVAAAAREDGAAPAAAAAQLPAGRPAALRQGTLKQQLMQHVAANLGGAAALALDNGGGALGQDDAEFEFSSGAPTPGDLTTQPSIEMWPAGSPTAPPAAGVSVAAATAAAVAQASEAAAVFERAATLESWHSAAAAAAAAGAPPLDDGWPGPHGSELSIGSRLHSLTLSSDSSRQLPPDDDSRVDKFALALHRVPALQLARPPPPAAPPPPPPPQQRLSSFTSFGGTPAAPPPERQWHLFTVSPDAPANPVLYWTGFLEGTAGGAPGAAPARFDLPAAKGPYRLDLGDVLYAPNVCQDGAGRWLLWGWLQERRKVGSYAYAGCLSLPRVLHVTDEGRLVQAPAPEVASLREGRAFHARGLAVPPDAVVPVAAVSGQRLDIECTIERGTALAVGLLFRSHEAEAEGSTALVYDWERNQLEAIFNVPTSWQPRAPPPADAFDPGEPLDPAALLCTPRFGGGPSRTPSLAALSPLRSPRPGPGTSSLSDLLAGDDDFAGSEASAGSLEELGGQPAARSPPPPSPLRRAGSSLSMSLQRSASNLMAIPGGGGGGGEGGGGGGGLRHSSSFPAGAFVGPGASLPRMGSLQWGAPGSFVGSPRASQHAADDDLDGDLDTLLEDLAAPMRGAEEAPAAAPEPRRVGGPLRMHPSDRLHLRVIVDHSCVEVYTGTGEVLSTRVYRGQAPEDATDAGIDFVAFGGAAIVEEVSAWEMGSAWRQPTEAATAAAAAAAAAAGLADVFRRRTAGQVVTAPGTPAAVGGIGAGGAGAAERADALLDDLLLGLGGMEARMSSPVRVAAQ